MSLIEAVQSFSQAGVMDVIRKVSGMMVKCNEANAFAIYGLTLHDCMLAMKTQELSAESPGVISFQKSKCFSRKLKAAAEC